MSNSLPSLPNDFIRIGHRGLERNQVDDTFWLNGTRIDEQIYNQELQRQIAWAAEQQQARRQAEGLRNAQLAQQQATMLMNVAYGYAPIYRGSPHEQAALTADNLPGNRSGGGGRKTVREAKEATIEQQRRANSQGHRDQVDRKGPSDSREPLSLKNTPLFGYLRWRFDSPFKPLGDAFIRWAWKYTRNQVRT